MKVIVVTGTPATGKTTLAQALAQNRGYKYVGGWDLIESEGLSTEYDASRDCSVVDEGAFARAVVNTIEVMAGKGEKGVLIDSHFSHMVPCESVDLCLVTTVSLKDLKKRLEERGYTAAKVRENLDAEIFELCYIEAVEQGHHVRKVDCSVPLEKTELDEVCRDAGGPIE